ncbi:hypothetical protein [Deinococcus roseus]|uniref:Uncharacterized protein n=1 Tax=Deinococcus roseus TaxID=392414 RepID=A0ABQ2CWL8_9DEIO|nr:hypothetical protein [Deinococcus roseus]GGJ23476.1 hypothetical protein GCM10008938_07020 [Deinococcus roseus]
MTETDLRELLRGGETFTVEFKSDSPDQKRGLSDDDLIEALVYRPKGTTP